MVPKIVRDEPKRLANIAQHGLDFADLDASFFENSLIVPGKRSRLIAVGRSPVGDILVVFAALGHEAISIVSMRYASRKERKLIDG
jgi:uncharacterized protein